MSETTHRTHGLSIQVIYKIADLLRAGYGVEDVGVKLSVNTEQVRELVDGWRNNGKIRLVFGHAQDPQREHAFISAYQIMTGRRYVP